MCFRYGSVSIGWFVLDFGETALSLSCKAFFPLTLHIVREQLEASELLLSQTGSARSSLGPRGCDGLGSCRLGSLRAGLWSSCLPVLPQALALSPAWPCPWSRIS